MPRKTISVHHEIISETFHSFDTAKIVCLHFVLKSCALIKSSYLLGSESEHKAKSRSVAHCCASKAFIKISLSDGHKQIYSAIMLNRHWGIFIGQSLLFNVKQKGYCDINGIATFY